MKNKFFYFVAAAIAAAVFTGCSPKEEKPMADSKSDMQNDMAAKNEKMKGDMMPDDMMSPYALEHGKIVEGNGGGTQLRINSMKMDAKNGEEVIINIEEKTPTIDAIAMASTKKASVTEGTEIYAWVSNAYTASLPPQTSAQIIFVNAQNEQDIPALVEIESAETAGDTVMVTDMQGMKWTVGSGADITMHITKEKVEPSALKKGVKALFWKDKADMMKSMRILVIEK